MNITLNSKQLGDFFPAFIRLGKDGSLLEVGARLAMRFQNVQYGRHWSDYFTVDEKFAAPNWDVLAQTCKPITLYTAGSGLELQGSVIQTDDGYFLTTRFRAPDIAALVNCGLSLSDFSNADSYVDRLVLASLHSELAKEAHSHSLFFDELRTRGAAFDRYMSRLFGFLAHDYSNTISLISLTLSRLKKLAATPILTSAFEEIEKPLKRATSLTKSLQALSKDDSLGTQPVCIDSVIKEHDAILCAVLGPKVEFSVLLQSNNCLVFADKSGFVASLLHLLENAREAVNAQGEVRLVTDLVDLNVSDNLPAGQYVRIGVIDAGEGLNPGLIRMAAEPFFSTKKDHSGLGLSLVKNWCAKNNGHAQITSLKPRGLRADILVPVHHSVQ